MLYFILRIDLIHRETSWIHSDGNKLCLFITYEIPSVIIQFSRFIYTLFNCYLDSSDLDTVISTFSYQLLALMAINQFILISSVSTFLKNHSHVIDTHNLERNLVFVKWIHDALAKANNFSFSVFFTQYHRMIFILQMFDYSNYTSRDKWIYYFVFSFTSSMFIPSFNR